MRRTPLTCLLLPIALALFLGSPLERVQSAPIQVAPDPPADLGSRQPVGPTRWLTPLGWGSGHRCDPPLPPTDLQASDGAYADRVEITWEHDAAGFAESELYRATSLGGTKTLVYGGYAKSYDDTNASPGVTYYYWAKVCDLCDCSLFSGHDTGYRSCDPPAVPGNVQATDGTYDDKVRVTWDGVVAADSYEVWRADSWDGARAKLGDATGTSYDDASATPGETYHYWLKACSDACDCSDFGGHDTGYRGCDPPAAPGNVQATDGTYDDKVRVTWDSVVDADSYEVWRAVSAEGAKTKLGEVSGASYEDTSATPGETYYYWVKACTDPCGCSDFGGYDTGSRSGACPEPPAPPENVQAADGTYSDKVLVRWDAVSGADEYEVYRAELATGVKTKLVSTTATSYDDTTAVPLTNYVYWVTTCTAACGCGDYSEGDIGYRSCPYPPNVPSSPTPAAGASGVVTDADLGWSGGHPCAGEAVTYDVYLEAGDSTPDSLVCDDAPDATCDPGPLERATDYYWQVTVNGLNGPVSGPVWGFATTGSGMDYRLYLPLAIR